jgi:hypothetical protein
MQTPNDRLPADSFERAVALATQPINGQLPRPWMSDLTHPRMAQVFIVGRNPARQYDATAVTHERHLDALFNRNGQSCRGLYDELVEPSLTRNNIDKLRQHLRAVGVTRVLETNVIGYSSAMSADLSLPEHAGGRAAGSALFRLLIEQARPSVLIAHGAGTIKALAKVLGARLPSPAGKPGEPTTMQAGGMQIIAIPSLAPPAWNRWTGWADSHLMRVASLAADALGRGEGI